MGSLQDSKDRARPLLPRLSQHCLLSSPTAPPSGCLIILNYLSPLKTPTNPTITMKWIICTVACLAFFAAANAELVEEDGDARLGFISVGSGGATTLTFNATSIQNAIILGLFILVLGALVLPLFGVSVAEEETGYGYGYEQPAYAYDEAASAVGYAKRSVDSVGPVLAAMASAQEKYEN